MTLSQLNYVVAVDTHRNFVEASKHCFISQPTLSMQIKKLEETLDVVIFDRTRQPVVPTQLGEAIIAQARVILREEKRLEELVRVARGEIGGEFHLGIIPTLSTTLLPRFLLPFTTRYPQVRLVIEELQTEEMIERLERDALDAGIAATPLDHPELHERPLFNEPFYLYISEKHPLAKKKVVAETDLLSQEVWLLSEGHCFRNQVTQLCGFQPHQPSGSPVRFESGNLQTLIRLVEQEFGMTLLPYLAVQDLERKEQKKRVRPFSAPVPVREVSLIHRRQFVKAQVTEVLFNEVLASLPKALREPRGTENHLLRPFAG